MAEYRLTKLGLERLNKTGVDSVGMLLLCVQHADAETKRPTIANIVKCAKTISLYRLDNEVTQLEKLLMIGGMLDGAAIEWAIEKGYMQRDEQEESPAG